jgi:AraC-like DNA-binding protein
MQFHITTDEVPVRQRFELWNAAIFGTLAISVQPFADNDAPFRAQLAARVSGPLLHLDFDADGFGASRQSREIAHRRWDSYWVYRESGPGAWFRIAGQELTTTAGDLVIADADAPFETRADRYAHQLWLIPKTLLDPHLPALRRPLVMRLSRQDGVNALAESYLAALTHNWDELSEAEMGPIADTLGRLIGIVCGAAADAQPDAVRAGRLAEAMRFIDRHLADPDLSPAGVATALRISVRTLHAAFEQSGTSFARHVARRRLEECRAALLGNKGRAVTDIAFAWGFSSLSGFYRAFHAAFGMTPGDLRAVGRGKQGQGLCPWSPSGGFAP